MVKASLMYKIAINGKANSGKNTIASFLKEGFREVYGMPRTGDWNKKAKIIAFADPIKEMILNMFPQADKENLYGSSELRSKIIPEAYKDNKPLTYRQALLDIGSLGRSYNENVWIDNLNNLLDKLVNDTNLVIVSDVRFKNEFKSLREQGFYIIRIYREIAINSETINHATETEQCFIKDEEFDYILFNNKPLNEVAQEIKQKVIPKIVS